MLYQKWNVFPMKCEDAQKVWTHPNGPIEGLKNRFPQAWKYFVEQIEGFIFQTPDPFNDKVHNMVPDGNYRITHRGDEGINEQIHDILGDGAITLIIAQWAEQMYGKKILLTNVCCSGCLSNEPPEKSDDFTRHLVSIQKAAVQIEMNA